MKTLYRKNTGSKLFRYAMNSKYKPNSKALAKQLDAIPLTARRQMLLMNTSIRESERRRDKFDRKAEKTPHEDRANKFLKEAVLLNKRVDDLKAKREELRRSRTELEEASLRG